MKFSVIIVFLGILFIGSGRSAVLPVSKYTTQSAETTPNKEAGDIIEVIVSSRSISLESSLVLPTSIARSYSESADWHKFLDFDSITSRRESKESILSKKNLNSSKYRIRHHPTYLVPVDIEPSRPTNPKPLTTSVVSTSVTVAEIAATPLSAMGYHSVIKLENKMDKENFMHIISLASSQEKIAVDSKATVFGKPLIPISELSSEEATGKMLQRRLVSIFTISSPAKPAILSCHKPESIVSIKCLSNFARLTFLSENHSNAKISIKGKNESVKLGHHNSVIYIHWWTSDGTLRSRISKIFTIDQLRSTCVNCRNLRAHLLLFEGEQGCVLPVTCNSAGSGKVKIDESYKQFGNLIEFDLPVISTSLSFQSTEGVEELQDGDRVKSGQQVVVTITGISEAFPVGLFVRECGITIANGPSIPLLSNGCSISNLLENFNLTSTIVNNIEVFSLNSRFTVYNSEKISQPLTFTCRIKVCERKCGSHSACQLHLINYSSKNSKQRTILEENLSQTVFIDPEESAEGEAELLRELHKEYDHIDLVDSKPTAENFVSAKRFYSTIFILSCIYTIILVFCVLCMKHYLIRPKVYMNELDEATITTPERCFLNMDQVSARRRSPTQTMVFD